MPLFRVQSQSLRARQFPRGWGWLFEVFFRRLCVTLVSYKKETAALLSKLSVISDDLLFMDGWMWFETIPILALNHTYHSRPQSPSFLGHWSVTNYAKWLWGPECTPTNSADSPKKNVYACSGKITRDRFRVMSVAPRRKCARNVVQMKEAMIAFFGSNSFAISCHCKGSKIFWSKFWRKCVL